MARKKKEQAEMSAADIAVRLLDLRTEKNALAAIEKTLTKDLMSRIKSGEKQGVFKVIPTYKLTVTDNARALRWAQENAPTTLTVNTTAARQFLMRTMAGVPEGFQLKETEQLRELSKADMLGEDEGPLGVSIEV